jgi:hypothetical protein
MRLRWPHPLALFTALVLVAVVGLPDVEYGRSLSADLLFYRLLLASPFVVLLFAHARPGMTFRNHVDLVCLNFPLLIGWQLVVTLMWLLHLGLWGAAIFGVLQCAVAAMLIAASIVPRLDATERL